MSSPTVVIELLMLSCIIDVEEKCDVATCDIPGAFMQADMDKTIHMKVKGTMAELLVKLDPKMYLKYVVKEKGKSVIYVELQKALYSTLQVSLLFWKNLTARIQSQPL
eukprot:2659827-Ditylum_brightwellii.AAC.1